MALTLECSCDADVSLCNLTQLIWRVQVTITQSGLIGASGEITLTGAHGSAATIFLNNPGGVYDFAFDLTPLADWLNPIGHFGMDSSLFQVNQGDYTISGADSIDQIYQCINVVTGSAQKTIVTAHATASNGVQKCETGTNDTRSVCSALTGTLFKSTPGGVCNGCSSIQFDYKPTPFLDVKVDVNNSGSICLCATGGTGDYTFSIVAGNLACGQNLNVSTGCIEGDPDGSCDASSSITFRVQDSGGADTGQSSGGQTIGGTANVFGAGATRLSGGQWTSDLVGQTITFGTASGVVSSVADGDHLTLTTAIGVFPNVGWSYTSPVIPPPPPGPPEFAEVTCGYIQSCPPGIGGGNQAF